MKKKLLIAEDEDMDFFVEVFQEDGYEVTHARDGEKALDLVMRDRPDGMLLDIRMPKIDGIDILKELQQKKLSPKTWVIIWTAFDNYGEPEKTILREYSDQLAYYLKKPINLEDLRAKVREIMSGEFTKRS